MLFVRFSGVTEESLHDVSTTIREVQAVLLSMIHKDTILVGHSLESDLKATKVIWNSKRFDLKVINSVKIFPLNRQAFTRLVDFWLMFFLRREGGGGCWRSSIPVAQLYSAYSCYFSQRG